MSQRSMYKYSNGDILKHWKENAYVMVTGFVKTHADYYICVPVSNNIDGGEMAAHLIDLYWNRVA